MESWSKMGGDMVAMNEPGLWSYSIIQNHISLLDQYHVYVILAKIIHDFIFLKYTLVLSNPKFK